MLQKRTQKDAERLRWKGTKECYENLLLGVQWLLRSQTADVVTSRRHALTHTHTGREHLGKHGVLRIGRETKGIIWMTMVIIHYINKNQR